MANLKLFYFELANGDNFLTVAEDEDEIYERAKEKYGEAFVNELWLVVDGGKWEKVKKQLDNEEIISLFERV